MPKLQLLSDLHLEFYHDGGAHFIRSLDPTGVDVLVLAGDIAVGWGIPKALRHFCEHFKDSTVLFTAGNHEYLKSSPGEVHKIIEGAVSENKNLIWLNNSEIELNGQRFIGGTMWYKNYVSTSKRYMIDFRMIKDFEPWVYEDNARFQKLLDERLRPGDIVITHHLPTERAVHPQWRGNSLNHWFVCDQDDLILERQPKMWAFGHTHSHYEHILNETRLICNPRGYPDEAGTGFVERLLVDF